MKINKGKPSGQYLGAIGSWHIYQTQADRYKLCAVDGVTGKANYMFAILDGKVDTHVGLDASKLKADHPELLKEVNKFFTQTPPAATESLAAPIDEADPFGDLALSRKRKLTPEQQWKRGLLQLRRIELEHAAAQKESVWDSAIRMMWAGIFKTRIEDVVARQALCYVQQHGTVSLDDLLQVEQEYYAGKYAPASCSTLEARLDLLAGNNEEVQDNGFERLQNSGHSASAVLPCDRPSADASGTSTENPFSNFL